MKIFNKIYILALVVLLSAACNDDDGNSELILTGISTANEDLNGLYPSTGIETAPIITMQFSSNLDESSVSDASVKLIRDYDLAEIENTLTVSGNTLTLTPSEVLGEGTLYRVSFVGLKSQTGQLIDPNSTRAFTTEGTFAPSGVVAHYNFENSAEDVIGDYDPEAAYIKDITYVDSRNNNAGKAASFNGSTSLIEIPNADDFLSHNDFSISFWVKTQIQPKGQFVLGLAAWYGFQFEMADSVKSLKMAMMYKTDDGTKTGEDSFYNGDGTTKDNGGWQGATLNKDVTASGGVGETWFDNRWVQVVVTYNSVTRVNSMYIDSELVKVHNFNLWPDGDVKHRVTGVAYNGNPNGNKLALGFIQGSENRVVGDAWADPSDPNNNHFKGELDDIRIFSKAITSTEVRLMYNSEKP